MTRRHGYDLPPGLVGHVEHYLRVERPQLLHGSDHDWLWVGRNGAPLREAGIERVIRRLSEKKFGRAVGPHSFRHAMGTTAPMADPRNPAVAAAILGNSKRVAEKSYNLGRQVEAALEFQASVMEDRRQSAAIARRGFARRNS